MKSLLTLLIMLASTAMYSQVNCSAVINWKYNGIVDIYEKPGGKIMYQVKNDSTKEDFLNLTILNQTSTHFYVSIGLAMNEDKKTGWIKKGDYIGAYIKGEKFPMDLTLYKTKSTNDKIDIRNWMPELLTIEECANEWTFVSLKQNGKTQKGWIETQRLCANSYTYCN